MTGCWNKTEQTQRARGSGRTRSKNIQTFMPIQTLLWEQGCFMHVSNLGWLLVPRLPPSGSLAPSLLEKARLTDESMGWFPSLSQRCLARVKQSVTIIHSDAHVQHNRYTGTQVHRYSGTAVWLSDRTHQPQHPSNVPHSGCDVIRDSVMRPSAELMLWRWWR
jgi:hypothetical protein